MAKIQEARDVTDDDSSVRTVTSALTQLARLLGRVAARQALSDGAPVTEALNTQLPIAFESLPIAFESRRRP